MSSNQEIAHRFAFHPATDDEKRNAHSSVRMACERAAQHIDEVCPDGREKALALTKLEEAMFWSNAALARHAGPATRVGGLDTYKGAPA